VLILIGSTRPAKIDGAREAVAAIATVDPRFARAVFETHDLTAIAPRMPMSAAEIVDGARRRAEALLAMETTAHASSPRFALGLEGGLDRMAAPVDRWTLQTWAAVSDGARWGYGAGPSIALPTPVVERVSRGEELGDVIDELAGVAVRGTRGAWGVLTRDLIGRRDAFRSAVIAAFACFYNGGAWGGQGE
jgi:inosine/xanthosine triphosphatase